jgi:hypothetical protein
VEKLDPILVPNLRHPVGALVNEVAQMIGSSPTSQLSIGPYLGQWGDDKAPEMRPRMRQRQFFSIRRDSAHGEQIKVERAWPPTLFSHPARRVFDLLEVAEDLLRRLAAFDHDYRIEVLILRRPADWRS